MRWRGYLFFFFGVLSVVFAGSVITTSDVHAVSDYTLTIDSSTPNSVICGVDSGRSCSDYSYIIFSSSSPIFVPAGDYFNYRIGLSDNSGRDYSVNPVLFPVTFSISSNLSYFTYRGLAFTLPSDTTISITLTDTLPSSCPPAPSGDLAISQNGTYDVSQYATATVSVSGEVIQGDYHDDLVSINNSIIIACAVPLVIYFF